MEKENVLYLCSLRQVCSWNIELNIKMEALKEYKGFKGEDWMKLKYQLKYWKEVKIQI